jgi:hypothetical protein
MLNLYDITVALPLQCNSICAHVQIRNYLWRENDRTECEVDACKTSKIVVGGGNGERLAFSSVAMQQANTLREFHVQVSLYGDKRGW